jgi:hypothetical protein
MTTKSDLQLAYEAIVAKQKIYSEAFAYYDGNQPLVYANERLRDVFKGQSVRFVENWCGVVIDSVKERIQITAFDVPDSVQEVMDAIWEANQLALESDDLHEAMLVTGEAYLIVWPDVETGDVEIYYNDPRLCHAFYRQDKPRQMRCAAKMWVDDVDETYRLVLYYPERMEYYKTIQKASSVSSYSAFVPDSGDAESNVVPNSTGHIPVFHFRLRKRVIKGDLYDVIPLQNGINKLLTDMMVAGEYGAFKQRWIISNADVTALRNAPNEIWQIPAGDGTGQGTQVGEFSPTELGNYLDAVEKLSGDVSRVTRLPLHYFYSKGGYPSGEALVAMEAPLTFKVKDRIERVEPIWKEAIVYALTLAGQTITSGDVVINWQAVHVEQPVTDAQVRLYDTQAGIPLEISLKRSGWTEAEIDDLRAAQAASGDALGENLLRNFDRGA